SNMWKLYIHRHTGAFMCHRCGSKGSWYDFKMRLDFGGQSPILSVGDEEGEAGDYAYDDNDENADEYAVENAARGNGRSGSAARAGRTRKRRFPSEAELKQYQGNLEQEVYPDAVQYLLQKRGISKE